MTLTMGSWKWRAGMALAAGAVLVTSACGSDGSSDDENADSSGDSAALGTANPATGDPVKIGIIYTGKTAAIDLSDDQTGAEAAVEYANEYLGGLAGRKIETVACETTGTPAGATKCGNEMAKEDVVAVVVNTESNDAVAYKALEPAGIPFFAYSSGAPDITAGENAFILTDSIATQLAAPAKLAADNGATKAAVVTIDVPAALGPVNSLAKGFYDKAGVDLSVVAVPAAAADMTPQIQIALKDEPDQVAVIGTAAFCTSAFKAIQSLGYDGTVVGIQQCIDTRAAGSLPQGYEGVKIFAPSSTDTSDPEVATYVAALKKYAPDLDPFGGSWRGAYASVIGFVRAMSDATGDINKDTVLTTLRADKDLPMPLATGQTFNCNGEANSIGTAFCASGALLVTLAKDGTPAGKYEAVDVSDLY